MSICRVRHVEPLDRFRIHPDHRDWSRWIVECSICPDNSTLAGLLPIPPGKRATWIGPTSDHATALAAAIAHADLHADRDQTCPTCGHVPDVAISREDTEALMKARTA